MDWYFRLVICLICICVAVCLCFAQDAGTTPLQTSEARKVKQRIEQYYKRSCAITVELKSGAVYYYVPNYGSEVKHLAVQKTKIAGKLEQVGAEEFLLGERTFIGYQYLTLRIRYEDVKKLRANLIPDELKSTGEFLFWCILLFPTGACAM